MAYAPSGIGYVDTMSIRSNSNVSSPLSTLHTYPVQKKRRLTSTRSSNSRLKEHIVTRSPSAKRIHQSSRGIRDNDASSRRGDLDGDIVAGCELADEVGSVGGGDHEAVVGGYGGDDGGFYEAVEVKDEAQSGQSSQERIGGEENEHTCRK